MKWGLAVRAGALMLEPSASTYTVAITLGLPQSTTWRYVAIYLLEEDPVLWSRVQGVLKKNLKRSRV